MSQRKHRNKGFTLVEVIVVLVILAILAAILIPSLTGYIDKANEKVAHTELHTVVMAARSAYAEVYAEYGSKGARDISYLRGHTSGASSDKYFAASLEGYINDEVIWGNIASVWIMEEKNIGINYEKDGVTYNYISDGETVTITKL